MNDQVLRSLSRNSKIMCDSVLPPCNFAYEIQIRWYLERISAPPFQAAFCLSPYFSLKLVNSLIVTSATIKEAVWGTRLNVVSLQSSIEEAV